MSESFAPDDRASARMAPPGSAVAVAAEVAPLCEPIAADDPCGPDLDANGDASYLNFFAHVEGILPTSFFSLDDGKPFDHSTIDIDAHLAALQPLLGRTHDLRLLVVKARLHILNRDLPDFALTVAAIAALLERYWDAVHPRPVNDSAEARALALSSLGVSTVMFPLQYAPLFEAPRVGSISYRAWMVASGEAKPRGAEPVLAAAVIAEAIAQAPPAAMASARRDLTLLSASLGRIHNAFMGHQQSAGIAAIASLAGKMLNFVAPDVAPAPEAASAGAAPAEAPVSQSQDGAARSGPAPASMDDAAQALAAIAQYYSRSEPSSPALPLVRQAHLLIGKSFLEVMTILMPGQVDKAAFQIGTDQGFDLPVEKLSHVSGVAPPVVASEPLSIGDPEGASAEAAPPRYQVETRAQAISLLDAVQRYFRAAEPSSPVPMLCERARALVERDFMGVLRDVLPKSALKNLNGGGER